jgi:segregation and condensation protein B
MVSRTTLPEPDEDRLISAIESILLVAGGPVSIAALARALEEPRPRIHALISRLRESLEGGIRLQFHGGTAQLVTAPENVETVQRFLGAARPPPLSRPAVETLTIIAYHQGATRPEIEAMRGVNSDRAVQTLLARGLVEELGQRDTLGRPMQYGTSFGFLEYFGLGSLDDLPPLEIPDRTDLQSESLGLRSISKEENTRRSALSEGP